MTYTEPVMGLAQHVNVGLISFADGVRVDDGAFAVWLVEQSELAPHVIQSYIDMQKLIGTCVAHAEHINAEFLHINKFILGKTDDELNQPGGKDFMKLKSDIISFVKRDEETKSLASSSFRTALEYFVHYRNIFTHGKLRLLCVAPEGFMGSETLPPQDGLVYLCLLPGRVSENDWYISYLDKENTVSIPVTRGLLNEYVRLYEETLQFIRAFRKVKKGGE